jgi:hypothetical protein
MHPTEVDERETIRRKHKKASAVSDRYTFGFSRTNYCDIEIFNLTGKATTSCKEFRQAFETLETDGSKPVVFFLSYDVGYKEGPDRFVRHVVCCIATRMKVKIEILGFDMRNLREISNDLRERLISEINGQVTIERPISYTNIACLERSSCVYLQRYKTHTDIGWCIAWALFFLEVAICAPVWEGHFASDLSVAKQKRAFAELYRVVNGELERRKTNGFIEDWFAAELEG